MMQRLRLLHQEKANRDFAAQVQVEEELMKTRLWLYRSILHISYIYTILDGNHRSTYDAKRKTTWEKLKLENISIALLVLTNVPLLLWCQRPCKDATIISAFCHSKTLTKRKRENADKQTNQRASVSANQGCRCSPVLVSYNLFGYWTFRIFEFMSMRETS